MSETTSNPDGLCENKRAIIDQIIAENRERPGAMMVVLNETQSKVGYISAPMQTYIARQLGVPAGAVHGVVTFYSFFTTEARGKHTVKFVVYGTAGHPRVDVDAFVVLK